ncbi:MAG: hypothetical protein WBW04_05065 [Nitrolancea sp.]
MTRKRMVVLAASMAVVAILAIGGFATVFAAGNPSSNGSDPSSRAQTFLDRLASNLGISTDKLQQGLKDTANQYVDQAEQSGKISSDQANAAKQRIANSNGLGPFTRFFRKRDQMVDHLQMASWQDIASTLNMTPQDLRGQIESGQTLKQIIESKNMTVDQVVSSVVSQVQTHLDAKVTAGTITSDQETTILNNLRNRLTTMINNGGPTFNQHTNPNATPASVPSA